jgi:uncharacterized protein (DUF1778 family)
MAKTQRIEMRADAESEDRINRAAAIERVSVSAFILDAATAAADRVLARTDTTAMPADQFDALIAALDVADEAPQLARVAGRGRRFEHT